MSETGWQDFWAGAEGEQRRWWTTPAAEVLDLLTRLPAGEYPRALDIGCGLGRHAVALARRGFAVTALDPAPSALEYLRDWAAQLGLAIETVQGSAQQAAGLFAPASFDLALAYNVLYHGLREDFASGLAAARGVLRGGGLLYFTAPSRRDGKFNRGLRIANNTFQGEESTVSADVHYFADEGDLRELLRGFTVRELWLDEHSWEDGGVERFSSYWQVLAEKEQPSREVGRGPGAARLSRL